MPKNNENAGKKKSVHISHSGVYLKPVLIQCDNAKIKYKSCLYVKHYYESIKKFIRCFIMTKIEINSQFSFKLSPSREFTYINNIP